MMRDKRSIWSRLSGPTCADSLHHSPLRVRHTEEAVPPAFAREDLLAARFRVARVLPFQQSSTPFISNLTLALFSGLLMIFAFPDWNLWSLGWIATAPLIMAIVREQQFWRSLVLGYATGTLFYMGSSHWVTHTMNAYGEIPLALSYIILLVFASMLGVFTALFAGVLALAIKRFGGWAMLAAPALWAATELARLHVTGMGWNALGYSQAFQPVVIQIARLGGVYIVSALLVGASTALVFALVYLERRRGLVVLTAAGVLAIAAVLYGQSLRLDSEEAGSAAVAVVQPNIPIDGPWSDPKFVDEMTLRHIRLSEQVFRDTSSSAPGEASADRQDSKPIALVVWPESPMNFEYDKDPELRGRIKSFTTTLGIHLLMSSWGFPEAGKDDGRAGDITYNSALVIAPSGEKIYQYDKIALVPFGEYVPARDWIPFMNRVPSLVYDLTPGTSFTLSDVAGARIGTLICFEVTRPDIARRLRGMGASALVQISNEAWYNSSAAARQMLAQAVFRAVENNIEIVRATNSGLSARIDRYGAIYDETPMFETATRVWGVKTTDEARFAPPTFYTRYGDLFALACAALSLVVAAAAVFSEKWKKREQEDD